LKRVIWWLISYQEGLFNQQLVGTERVSLLSRFSDFPPVRLFVESRLTAKRFRFGPPESQTFVYTKTTDLFSAFLIFFQFS